MEPNNFPVKLYRQGEPGKPPSVFTIRVYIPIHMDASNRDEIRQHVITSGYRDVQGQMIYDLATADRNVVRTEHAWLTASGGRFQDGNDPNRFLKGR
jgi:hypothetical protein